MPPSNVFASKPALVRTVPQFPVTPQKTISRVRKCRSDFLSPGNRRPHGYSRAALDWSLPVDISRDGKTFLFDEQGEESGPTYTAAVRDMHGSPPIPLGPPSTPPSLASSLCSTI
jgi:hypothetical protein